MADNYRAEKYNKPLVYSDQKNVHNVSFDFCNAPFL